MAAIVLILRTVMAEAAHLSTVISKWLSYVLSNKIIIFVFMCVQFLFEGWNFCILWGQKVIKRCSGYGSDWKKVQTLCLCECFARISFKSFWNYWLNWGSRRHTFDNIHRVFRKFYCISHLPLKSLLGQINVNSVFISLFVFYPSQKM